VLVSTFDSGEGSSCWGIKEIQEEEEEAELGWGMEKAWGHFAYLNIKRKLREKQEVMGEEGQEGEKGEESGESEEEEEEEESEEDEEVADWLKTCLLSQTESAGYDERMGTTIDYYNLSQLATMREEAYRLARSFL
jgi:hypothetical protein